jgi:hypothetical protein
MNAHPAECPGFITQSESKWIQLVLLDKQQQVFRIRLKLGFHFSLINLSDDPDRLVHRIDGNNEDGYRDGRNNDNHDIRYH